MAAERLIRSVRRAAQALWPAPLFVDGRERLRMAAGCLLGMLVTGLLSRWMADPWGLSPWLVAPIGASAVLVFGVPSSPLAQPWSVVGGNTVSALAGVACASLVSDPAAAGALAVALAIAAMVQLRCLHPPGGASALFAVLAHATHAQFALFPVLTNSLLLVAAGMAWHALTGKRYPHAPARPEPGATGAQRFTPADLDAALVHYNQVLDVSRDDLEALLHHAEAEAYRRNFGHLRCGDIMSREPVTAIFGTELQEAWALMRRRRIKALPVVDRARRIVGIVTTADFMRQIDLDVHQGIGDQLRALVRRVGTLHSSKPEVVGQIMTRQVRVVSEHRSVVELVPLFTEDGHHHIPVIDAERRLVGIITQSDLVRALHRAVR
ncbi:HPP family protein [Acidovorax sp. NCPPB 4044]|uniref:HPP family protein n=1 Tax=Acidovorax sp. NCPPB 4044 TaxID=2940490 RepID=UPI00230379D1|nr:HPP family protein [Acidovorax sp. NCPPB 4044]MDA8519370.1 HPP family protein [Acidovorax sp. NCPPB 4044]